jgi:glycine/D-amino acid oxidase-like deaminating enzyme
VKTDSVEFVSKTCDAVVVGGGVIGCAVAYYLQKGGLMTTVVERDSLCSAASGANQGGATFSRTLPPFTELARESQRIFENLEEELGCKIELEELNYLLCAIDVDSEKERMLQKTFENLRDIGTECRLFLREGVRKLDMPLGPDVQGAIEITKGIYILWPFKLVFGFALNAEKIGATILASTEVKEIKVTGRRVSSVVTDKGELKTRYVINAAGCWSSEIGKMVGINIPIKARKGQVLVTEPTRPYPYRYIMDIDYLSVEHSQREKVEITTTLMQHGHGNWTIGSSRELAGFNKGASPESISLLAKKAVRFLPDLRLKHCIRCYAGLRPFCYVDGYPILGETDKVKGFVIAAGHGGSGVKLSAATGKLIAEEIVTGKRQDLLEPFRYSRFAVAS